MNCDKNKGLCKNGDHKKHQIGLKGSILFLAIALFSLGCDPSSGNNTMALLAALNSSNGSVDPGEEYSGGYTTNFVSNAFSFDIRAANLRSGGATKFNKGNSFFNIPWVSEGSSSPAGLGPTFNTNSCQNCHQGDGRGAPPSSSGSLNNFPGILVRLSQNGSNSTTGGPVGLDNYGLQLNHKGLGCNPAVYDSNFNCDTGSGSITGSNFTPPEGAASVSYGSIAAPNYPSGSTTYPEGTNVTLNQPTYTFTWNPLFGDPTASANGFNFSTRTAPMISGLGLLQAIPESTILGWADPSDSDGDGISGKVNMVWDASTSSKVLGRFGWKANEPSLSQQNQGAFLGDMGITSPLFPTDNCPSIQTACITNSAGTTGIEISANLVDAVVFYSMLVGVPARRNVTDTDVVAGKALFTSVGCAGCHKPYVQTGYVSGFPEISYQHIKPYTDLLLHDMGPGLADGRPDFDANGQEWRTPPLWGLGLIQTVNGHLRLLHDGRANGIEEAILWHGGEASTARGNFQSLTATQRQQLITFLESL